MPAETAPRRQPAESIDLLDLLGRLGEIDDQKIADFRDKINPELRPVFDQANKDDQKILTAIDSFSDAELAELKKQARQNDHLVGFHDLNNHLTKLIFYTNNRRYLNN